MKDKEKVDPAIGKRLAHIRSLLGMIQADFAKSIGKVPSYISDIESGKKNPGFKTLTKILDVHNINPAYLLSGREPYFNPKLSSGDISEVFMNPDAWRQEVGDYVFNKLKKMNWYLQNVPYVRLALVQSLDSVIENDSNIIKKALADLKEKGIEPPNFK